MSRLQKLGVVLATTTAFTVNFAGAAFSQNMDELVAAAKAEGMLTTIALPHSWCGYGDVIAALRTAKDEGYLTEQLAIDPLPKSSRLYFRDEESDEESDGDAVTPSDREADVVLTDSA